MPYQNIIESSKYYSTRYNRDMLFCTINKGCTHFYMQLTSASARWRAPLFGPSLTVGMNAMVSCNPFQRYIQYGFPLQIDSKAATHQSLYCRQFHCIDPESILAGTLFSLTCVHTCEQPSLQTTMIVFVLLCRYVVKLTLSDCQTVRRQA
jgi:hypothetical protein